MYLVVQSSNAVVQSVQQSVFFVLLLLPRLPVIVFSRLGSDNPQLNSQVQESHHNHNSTETEDDKQHHRSTVVYGLPSLMEICLRFCSEYPCILSKGASLLQIRRLRTSYSHGMLLQRCSAIGGKHTSLHLHPCNRGLQQTQLPGYAVVCPCLSRSIEVY